MFKKIKNFFKWIADHIGISWIARKISSGCKRLFGSKKSKISVAKQSISQQGQSSGKTTIEEKNKS
ncbi:hypothetical protein [Wolbachia endosymbiont of Tribolium confusum]|uniref:hypothetical protein n=1 Tax=Wolbachia endosymbiont of Tribolium confusum TaxID=214474 RepID=UPI001CF56C13|nr:hypothetical protein [Wolbachia endosymbiont of Tribolium confusum]MCA7010695.1 hypothetical protein [Wolbachia endosymbiont of Tribolium confusum]